MLVDCVIWLIICPKWTIKADERFISMFSQFDLEIDYKQRIESRATSTLRPISGKHTSILWYSVGFHEDLVIAVCLNLGAK